MENIIALYENKRERMYLLSRVCVCFFYCCNKPTCVIRLHCAAYFACKCLNAAAVYGFWYLNLMRSVRARKMFATSMLLVVAERERGRARKSTFPKTCQSFYKYYIYIQFSSKCKLYRREIEYFVCVVVVKGYVLRTVVSKELETIVMKWLSIMENVQMFNF